MIVLNIGVFVLVIMATFVAGYLVGKRKNCKKLFENRYDRSE